MKVLMMSLLFGFWIVSCGSSENYELQGDYSLGSGWKDGWSPKFIGHYDFNKGQNIFAFKKSKGGNLSQHFGDMRKKSRQLRFGEYKTFLSKQEYLFVGEVEFKGNVTNDTYFRVSRKSYDDDTLEVQTRKLGKWENAQSLKMDQGRLITRAGYLIGFKNLGKGKIKVFRQKLGSQF